MSAQPSGPVSWEDWQRRLQHRRNSVAAIKATMEYKCKVRLLEMGKAPVESIPRTPDPTNFSVSKRQWEASIQRWRVELRDLQKQYGPMSCQ